MWSKLMLEAFMLFLCYTSRCNSGLKNQNFNATATNETLIENEPAALSGSPEALNSTDTLIPGENRTFSDGNTSENSAMITDAHKEPDFEQHGNNPTIASSPELIPIPNSDDTNSNVKSGSLESGGPLASSATSVINNINSNDPVKDNKTPNPTEKTSSMHTSIDIQTDEFSTVTTEAPDITTPISTHATDNIGTEFDKKNDSSSDEINMTTQRPLPPITEDGDAHVQKSEGRPVSSVEFAEADKRHDMNNKSLESSNPKIDTKMTPIPTETKTNNTKGTREQYGDNTSLSGPDAPRTIYPISAALTPIVLPPDVLYKFYGSERIPCVGNIQDLPSGWSRVKTEDFLGFVIPPSDVFSWNKSADDTSGWKIVS